MFVRHAATLPREEADAFLAAAAALPWDEVRHAFAVAPPPPPPDLRPPQALTWRRQERQPGIRRRLADVGERFLRGGRVATVLLAGGQGTRLGVAEAKGALVLGPEADRTLFRVERHPVAIETTGAYTTGMTVVDWRRTLGRPENTDLLLGIDAPRLVEMLAERLGSRQ